ncbi:PDZ domain-containing protein [Vogesella fluminis]|uniref:PDZ domain-containing protein n=1 Tax=Vogesella fluminis TaxID=1069161 RepID=UPI00364256C8
MKTAGDALGVKLVSVLDSGAAQAAGLAGGDVVIAVNGVKVADLDKALGRCRIGDTVKIHAFRRDELNSYKVTLAAMAADTCRLRLQDGGAGWPMH